jgi:hypothetical protein
MLSMRFLHELMPTNSYPSDVSWCSPMVFAAHSVRKQRAPDLRHVCAKNAERASVKSARWQER